MSVVTTGTQIILWCFNERNSSKFKVVIGNGNDIDDLKEAIKEKCKPLFDGFASSDLILWRVDATQVTSEILKDKLEDTAKTIGETFHNVKGGDIRVIVRAPDTEQPGGETSRNERIRDEDLNNYWNAIKVLEINEKDLFLKLSDANILGEQDGTSTLFIRKCYRDLSTVVLNDTIRRIRITGNPGIGKTYFGYYLLYLLARRGATILYENVARKSSYVFDGEEVFRTYDKIITDSYKSRRDVWYIVDGMEPEKVNARTILVCSPKKSHYANFDKYSLVTIRYMPEWSLDEIHTCRAKMFPDFDKKKADELFSMWGGIPRFVLEQADEYAQQQKLINAVELCGDKIFNYIGGHDASPEISHALVHLWTNLPTEEDENNADEESVDVKITYIEEIPYTKQLYYFASDYVARLVTEKCKQDILGKLLRNLEVNLSTGTSDQFLGTCFEQIAHRILREGGKFNVRSLELDSDPHNVRLTQSFDKQEDILTFSEIKDIENDKYYQPEIKNFPAIDAIRAPDILLQMTTSMTHPIEMVGLNRVYDKLERNSEISFYFVVPAQLYDRYQKQGFVTTKKNNVQRLSTWIRQHVKQYALRMDTPQLECHHQKKVVLTR